MVPFRAVSLHSSCSQGTVIGGHRTDRTPLWMGGHDGLELIRAFPIFTGSRWGAAVVLTGSEEQEVTGQPSRLPSLGDQDGLLPYPVL